MTNNEWIPELKNIAEYLDHWANIQADKPLFSFSDDNGNEREKYSYGEFYERTVRLASYLSTNSSLAPGDRVLLVYPPGLELIIAFYACIRVGIIPVLIYPPSPVKFDAGIEKMAYVIRDCVPKFALTTRSYLRSFRLLMIKRRLESIRRKSCPLPEIDWITTDKLAKDSCTVQTNHRHPIAFIQYTSGSTSDPKGVIVTHENLIRNTTAVFQDLPHDSYQIGISWLPQYHDLGLIGNYIYPVLLGGSSYGFSPFDFLKRPILWLEMITKRQGQWTAAPNFAYEYCLREEKVPTEQLQNIDLNSVNVMMSAAEPVRASTYERFLERFSLRGLRREAYITAYGLAENTVATSMYGRQSLAVNKQLLQEGVLNIRKDSSGNNNETRLVSCGRPLKGVDIRIVDAESRTCLGDNRIGEIWVSGDSKCKGYWNREELNKEVFHARLSSQTDSSQTFLVTGDLGFMHEGELFVCGRSKDMIIIRGANYYPQDIEATVEEASPQIRKGCTAAFSVDLNGEENLVVAAEVKDERSLPDLSELATAIRQHHFIEPHVVTLLPPQTIPKTTSGKISRSRCSQRWLTKNLPVILSYETPTNTDTPSGSLRDQFHRIANRYNLKGTEKLTFSEVGMDSISAVELICSIKDFLEENRVPNHFIKEVDVRVLQRLTVVDFFETLDQFDRNPSATARSLRRKFKTLSSETEASENTSMRADIKLDLPQLSVASPIRPIENLLLTGATGFFGPFLLSSLLENPCRVLHVLIRANDPRHGLSRIRASLQAASLLTRELDARLESQVRVICGDLSRSRFGLKNEKWESLSRDVQGICHNGALVNYMLNYDAMRPVNVEGTRELLRLAFEGSPKTFDLISTTFVSGWRALKECTENDGNISMKSLDFGYSQTKWVAERLTIEAAERGLDVRIYRPAFISASLSAVGSQQDITIRLLSFMITHGIGVNSRNQVSLIPVDIVANNIAAILDLTETEGNIFHVTADQNFDIRDITLSISRQFGYPFEYYDPPEFVAEMSRRCKPVDPMYPLLDFATRFQQKIKKMEPKRYRNEQYKRSLQQTAKGRNELPLDKTVALLVEFMLKEGMIPNPPHAGLT